MRQDWEPYKDNSWSDSFLHKDTWQLRYYHTMLVCLLVGMMSSSTVTTVGEGITGDIWVSYSGK